MIIITKTSNILGDIQSFNIITPTDAHGYIIHDAVLKYRRNYRESKEDRFVKQMLKRIRTRLFRIHLIGHFYSQDYVDKWVEIATKKPLTIFYAYVRSEEEGSFDYSKRPPNFFIINVDEKFVDDAQNTVYTTEKTVLQCGKFTGNTKCKICMRCLNTPIYVGNKPWV